MSTASKPLDMMAWVLVGIGILGVAASVWLRSHFNDAALKRDVQALSYADGKLWIGLDNELLSLDKDNALQRVPLSSLGVKNDTIRQVIASDSNVILSSLKGYTYVCTSMQSLCHKVSETPEEDSYNNLIALPNGTYLSVNNFSASIVSHQLQNGKRIKAEQYAIPDLDTNDFKNNTMVAKVGELDGFYPDRLYRPNSGYVIDNQYIQSDTGNYRIVSWPLADGRPDFKQPKLLTETEQQPYNFGLVKGAGVYPVDKLIALEGPPVLTNGKLATYTLDDANTRSDIPLPFKDPTLFAQGADNTFYVMAAKTGELASVTFQSSMLAPSVSEVSHSGLASILQENFTVKSRFELLKNLAWGLFLLPVIMLLLLVKMGYNLNQDL